MRSVAVKDFLLSGAYIMWRTSPYSFGEVLAEALTPMVKRMVFLLLLLGNFRYLSKHAVPNMPAAEKIELLTPVFLSIFAVVALPLIVAFLGKFSSRRRKEKSSDEIVSKYRQLLFRADVGRKKWERYYDGQKSLMVYFVFVCLISPAFLYYNWHIFIAYFVTAVLFATVCTIKFEFSTEYKIGRVLNRFVNSNPYINTIRFLMFSLYILGCAVIIVFEPRRIPVEFIFVIIIGMRVQLARGKNVISFFHWEADNGVKAIQQDDKA